MIEDDIKILQDKVKRNSEALVCLIKKDFDCKGIDLEKVLGHELPNSIKQKLHELGDDKENPRYQNENFKKVEEQKPDWLINIFKSKNGISVVCNETLVNSFTPTEKWTIKHGLLQFINESLNDAKP